MKIFHHCQATELSYHLNDRL